jgi:hypothetical protein
MFAGGSVSHAFQQRPLSIPSAVRPVDCNHICLCALLNRRKLRMGGGFTDSLGNTHMSQFAIDRRNGVLLVSFTGPFTPDNLAVFDDELASVIAREGAMPIVVDFTDASCTGVKASTFEGRGRRSSVVPGKPRLFVTNNELIHGLLRLYSAYQDDRGEKCPLIVRSRAEAFKALSLVDPSFEPLTVQTLGQAAS